jgi:hypothetical protein
MPLAVLIVLAVLALAAPVVAQGNGAGTTCANQGGPCPQEQQVMDPETTYKGLRLRIVTQSAPDGKWRAHAEFADQPGPPVKAAQDGYTSEQEAYTAALSAAMAQVDRSRAAIGKP